VIVFQILQQHHRSKYGFGESKISFFRISYDNTLSLTTTVSVSVFFFIFGVYNFGGHLHLAVGRLNYSGVVFWVRGSRPSGGPKIFEISTWLDSNQCISPVVIYRKCTQRTIIFLLCGKRQLFKKI